MRPPPLAANTRAPRSPGPATHRPRAGHPDPRETHAPHPRRPRLGFGTPLPRTPSRATWGGGRAAGGQAAGRRRAGAAAGEGPRGRHQAHGAPGAAAQECPARAQVASCPPPAPGPDPGGRAGTREFLRCHA